MAKIFIIKQQWYTLISSWIYEISNAENIGHKYNMLSRCFNIHFKKNMKDIKYLLQKRYLFVLSLIMFYHNRTSFVYKVKWYVIYSFINNLLCLDYLGILQQKLSTHNNKFEK